MARPKSSPDDKRRRLAGCLGVWVASIAHLPETGSKGVEPHFVVHSYLSCDLKLSSCYVSLLPPFPTPSDK